MRRFEGIFDEEKMNVHMVSLVHEPATDELGVAFNKEEEKVEFSTISKEQRKIIGLILKPDYPVYRKDDRGDYTLEFSKDTIEKMAYNFQRKGYQNNSTIGHSGQKIDGVTFVETWIVEDSKIDKSALYGMEYPEGSWVAMMKVYNDEVWENYVKTGNVRGFSIDGVVKFKEINNNANTVNMSKLDKVVNAFKDVIAVAFSEEEEVKKEEVKAEEVVAETKTVEDDKPEDEKEVIEDKAEDKVEEKVEEAVEMSKEEMVEFSSQIAEAVKKEVDSIKVEFSKKVETLEGKLKAANDEIVELKKQPVGKAIKSQPTQKKYEEMSEYEKYLANK